MLREKLPARSELGGEIEAGGLSGGKLSMAPILLQHESPPIADSDSPQT